MSGGRSDAEGGLIEINPIGYVRNSAKKKVNFHNLISEIVIDPDLEEGLHRIEEQKEIYVIWYFHRSDSIRMRVHPRRDLSQPIVGVFASRSPTRPNFLGLTRVELLARHGNVLVVKGLDAFDGTPVIDIKPALRWDQVDKNHK
jgi:tRNA (adenine37-N6)-methyltransferase